MKKAVKYKVLNLYFTALCLGILSEGLFQCPPKNEPLFNLNQLLSDFRTLGSKEDQIYIVYKNQADCCHYRACNYLYFTHNQS